jgi:hypothetical protein
MTNSNADGARQNMERGFMKKVIVLAGGIFIIVIFFAGMQIYINRSQKEPGAKPREENSKLHKEHDTSRDPLQKPVQQKPQEPVMALPQRQSSVNFITQAAVSAGVLSSVSTINKVTNFLTSNSISGAYLFIPPQLPDAGIFSVSVEIMPENAASMYASASFVPVPGANPQAVYDAVEYVHKSPKELRNTVFRHIVNEQVLKKDIIILDAGDVKVFLMPAGEGCVVIRKEVVR